MTDWRGLGRAAWSARLQEAGVDAVLAADLASFLVVLGTFSKAMDLVGRVDAARLVREHVLESLAAAPLMPERGRLLDVGSGNGFPALPLLLARRSVAGVLLEPRERRWAFLREAVRDLELDADVRRERLESHAGSGYDVVTVRAVAPEVWAPRCAELVGGNGVVLWWAAAGAGEGVEVPGMRCVLTSRLPDPGRGGVTVWRRCST